MHLSLVPLTTWSLITGLLSYPLSESTVRMIVGLKGLQKMTLPAIMTLTVDTRLIMILAIIEDG